MSKTVDECIERLAQVNTSRPEYQILLADAEQIERYGQMEKVGDLEVMRCTGEELTQQEGAKFYVVTNGHPKMGYWMRRNMMWEPAIVMVAEDDYQTCGVSENLRGKELDLTEKISRVRQHMIFEG